MTPKPTHGDPAAKVTTSGGSAPVPLSENAWAQQFEQLAALYRWRWHHDHDSRRQVVDRKTGEVRMVGDADAADFPDYCLWRDRVIFVELKRDGEDPTPGQERCLAELRQAGQEVHIWRPKDLLEVRAVLAPLHTYTADSWQGTSDVGSGGRL